MKFRFAILTLCLLGLAPLHSAKPKLSIEELEKRMKAAEPAYLERRVESQRYHQDLSEEQVAQLKKLLKDRFEGLNNLDLEILKTNQTLKLHWKHKNMAIFKSITDKIDELTEARTRLGLYYHQELKSLLDRKQYAKETFARVTNAQVDMEKLLKKMEDSNAKPDDEEKDDDCR